MGKEQKKASKRRADIRESLGHSRIGTRHAHIPMTPEHKAAFNGSFLIQSKQRAEAANPEWTKRRRRIEDILQASDLEDELGEVWD